MAVDNEKRNKIKEDINTNLPDNDQQLISPQTLRDTINNVVDNVILGGEVDNSYHNLVDKPQLVVDYGISLTDANDQPITSPATIDKTIKIGVSDSVKDAVYKSTSALQKGVYDPNNVEADAFSMANMKESANNLILTKDERTKINNSVDKKTIITAGYGLAGGGKLDDDIEIKLDLSVLDSLNKANNAILNNDPFITFFKRESGENLVINGNFEVKSDGVNPDKWISYDSGAGKAYKQVIPNMVDGSYTLWWDGNNSPQVIKYASKDGDNTYTLAMDSSAKRVVMLRGDWVTNYNLLDNPWNLVKRPIELEKALATGSGLGGGGGASSDTIVKFLKENNKANLIRDSNLELKSYQYKQWNNYTDSANTVYSYQKFDVDFTPNGPTQYTLWWDGGGCGDIVQSGSGSPGTETRTKTSPIIFTVNKKYNAWIYFYVIVPANAKRVVLLEGDWISKYNLIDNPWNIVKTPALLDSDKYYPKLDTDNTYKGLNSFADLNVGNTFWIGSIYSDPYFNGIWGSNNAIGVNNIQGLVYSRGDIVAGIRDNIPTPSGVYQLNGTGRFYGDGSMISNYDIGSIKPFLTTRVPMNYVRANGALLDRRAYPELFRFASSSGMIVSDADWLDVSKQNWGKWSSGDGSTTFRVPMLDGEFIRVLDNRGNSTASTRSIKVAGDDTGGSVNSGIHAGGNINTGGPVNGGVSGGGGVNINAGNDMNIGAGKIDSDSITNKAVDANRTPGSWQGDAIRNLTGWFGQPVNTIAYGGVYDSNSASGVVKAAATQTYFNNIPNYRTEGGDARKFPLSYNFDASLQVPTAVENRPRNVAYNWYIRAL